jgi:hypothetical protein
MPGCDTTWSKGVVPTGGTAVVDAVAIGPQSEVVAAGVFTGSIDFGTGTLTAQGIAPNLFVVKLDCQGKTVWAKRYGAPDVALTADAPVAIAIDAAGGIALTGYFKGVIDFGNGPLTGNGIDGFIAKLDANGAAVWSKRFGSAQDNDQGTGVAVTPAGHVVATGMFFGLENLGAGVIGTSGQLNLFAAELDAAGNVVWNKTFGRPSSSATLTRDGAGNLVLCGGTNLATLDFGGGTLTSNNGVFVAKLTSAGNHVFSKAFGGGAFASCFGASVDSTGAIAVTGSFSGGALDFGGGSLVANIASSAFVAKLASNGSHVFSKSSGPNTSSISTAGQGVAFASNGDVVVGGGFGGTLDFGSPLVSMGAADAFVARLDSTGALASKHGFGGTDNQFATALALDPSGKAVIGGYYIGTVDFGNGALPPASDQAFFVAKVAP